VFAIFLLEILLLLFGEIPLDMCYGIMCFKFFVIFLFFLHCVRAHQEECDQV
jgi:hypothetical protein